ncbi:hypothetical protein IPF37_03095 [bacterium]|nr:MAG: hypothetical protein IPF37_03095 [bacterium]
MSIRNKVVYFLLIAIIVMPAINAAKQAEWTILTYIQADNSLASFALKNIQNMQKAASNNNINILVHWNQPENRNIVRYRVTQKALIEDKNIGIKTYDDHEKSLVDAMQWAALRYPAKKYMLNLWNHGSGIIDRVNYLKGRDQIRSPLNDTSWLEVPGLKKKSPFRGILYSDTNRTYLNNQQLTRSLKAIAFILGKKIDVVGMDACFMAMLEVAYQIKDHAKVLVASQNSEPGLGWHYEAFLNNLSKNPHLFNAPKLSKHIVNTYQKLYAGSVNFYTQSAINLNAIDPIKENINQLVASLEQCKMLNEQKIKAVIQTASNKALNFHVSDFIDLHSFYTALLNAIKGTIINKQANKNNHEYIAALHDVRAIVRDGLTSINQAVYHSTAAPQYSKAHGISIYVPRKKIHSSYAKTMFANDSLWLHFLETFFTSYYNFTEED